MVWDVDPGLLLFVMGQRSVDEKKKTNRHLELPWDDLGILTVLDIFTDVKLSPDKNETSVNKQRGHVLEIGIQQKSSCFWYVCRSSILSGVWKKNTPHDICVCSRCRWVEMGVSGYVVQKLAQNNQELHGFCISKQHIYPVSFVLISCGSHLLCK